MTTTSTEPVSLDVEDFRRLGVRPNELRLAVIRKAAARSTLALAQQHLQAPSPQLALQLSRVATSAYRLLDPRQRSVAHHRAHVGRILPNALTGAGQTKFFSRETVAGPESAAPFQSPDASGDVIMNDEDWMVTLDIVSHANPIDTDSDEVWLSKLSDGDLLDTTPLSRRLKRIRSRIFHPWVWISIGGLFIGTMLGLATIAPHLNGPHFRLAEEIAEIDVQNESSVAIVPEPAPARTEIASVDAAEFLEDPFDVAIKNNSAVRSGAFPSTPITEAMPLDTEVAAKSVEFAPKITSLPPLTDVPSIAPEIKDSRSDEADPSMPLATATLTDPISSLPSQANLPLRADELHPVPSAELIQHSFETLHDLVPSLADTNESDEIARLISELQVLAAELSPGSADHWVIHFTIARLTWAEQTIAAVQANLQPLTQNYKVFPSELLATTYLATLSPSPAVLISNRTFGQGIDLCETLLSDGEFKRCEEVSKALIRHAASDDTNARQIAAEDFVQAAQQMDRLFQTVTRTFKRYGGIENVSADVAEAGMLGRYECLMCRHWNPKSLSWLARSSDVRITASARDEINLPVDATSDEIAIVAQRWLAVSLRESGRSAESIRLHAIELLHRAESTSAGLKKLELQRLIEEQTEMLPVHLQERFTTTSIKIDSSTMESKSRTPGESTEPTQAADTRPAFGMSGRLLVLRQLDAQDESTLQDVGVQIDYQLDVAITPSMIDTIRNRLNRELSKLTIRLACELQMDDAGKVSFSVAPGMQDQAQMVSIDGQLIQFDPLESSIQQSLSAGIHRIEWTIDVERISAKAFLGIHDAESGRRLPVVPVDPTQGSQIPTTLTVAVVRTDG